MNQDVYLGFGANIGNPVETLQQAIHALVSDQTQVIEKSLLYTTAPIGGPADQDDYVNAVVKIRTCLSPIKLLQILQSLDERFGRERIERWGARTLDIDILLYGTELIDSPDLNVPHPQMHLRRFVLQPLIDIAPTLKHPGTGIRFADYLPMCEDQSIKQLDAGW